MKGGLQVNDKAGPSNRFCLVKWLSGRDVGTFTHNLDLDWVKDFNEADDYRSESHVIEWRVPPMPRSGWPLFDGQILEISDDLDFLKQRLQQEQDNAKKPKTHARSPTPPNSPSTPKKDSIGIEDVQKLLCSLISSGAKQISTPSKSLVEEENVVKVGEVLVIKKSTYMEAKFARTPSSMTMELVRAAFSDERRKRSSYAGQQRTRDGIKVKKPSLKKYRKMKDIQNFVNERFPHFTQANFGQAVNSCLGANVDLKPKPKLVDESDEEV